MAYGSESGNKYLIIDSNYLLIKLDLLYIQNNHVLFIKLSKYSSFILLKFKMNKLSLSKARGTGISFVK